MPKPFDPENLVRSVIAIPLLAAIAKDPEELYYVIIDVNNRYPGGRDPARTAVGILIDQAVRAAGTPARAQGMNKYKTLASTQYCYAHLEGKVIRKLVELDQAGASEAIFHVWPDFIVRAQIWKSVPAVKADACRRAFAATGSGIVWAMLDSGIDGTHPHFEKHKNLRDLPSPVCHMDFTADEPAPVDVPADGFGHGTHAAGILAGELEAGAKAIVRSRDAEGVIAYEVDDSLGPAVSVAPECKLVSYRVLDDTGKGPVSNVIAAIEHIQKINGYGREIVIHGVNLSLGYDFDPEWFACGQSPVCVEVNRLVKSGVAVVAAAGNVGEVTATSINDPGNADCAITVGATHRDSPHTYGVSYFSCKGPTGDGRPKPDVLAPGERVISCGAGPDLERYKKSAGVAGQAGAYYVERSGTSMAAPHVSGIIAGLLSIRREYIGRPEEVKRILLDNATDLGRDRYSQGRGLVDMMRAIQAI